MCRKMSVKLKFQLPHLVNHMRVIWGNDTGAGMLFQIDYKTISPDKTI